MPLFRYRDGLIAPGTIVSKLVDPDDLNRRFDDIARFLNGNLGIENVRTGRIFTPAHMSGGRDFFSVHFHCDSAIGTWPATAQIFLLKQSAVLIGVDIDNASVATGAAFAATLYDGTNTICTLTDDHAPARPTYTVTKMTGYANLTAPKTISVVQTLGTFCGITLHFTSASQVP